VHVSQALRAAVGVLEMGRRRYQMWIVRLRGSVGCAGRPMVVAEEPLQWWCNGAWAAAAGR
jgi:hypothetical protein